MAPNRSNQETFLLQTAQQELTISAVLPFEPRSTSRKGIEAGLKRIMDEVEQRLLQQASRQYTRQVCARLRYLFEQLDYGAASKSVAFCLNAESGKLVYWQMPFSEAVLVGNGFNLRGLLPFRKEEKQYLLLGMGDHFGGIYLGNGKKLSRLVANAPVSAATDRQVVAPTNPEQARVDPVAQAVRHFDNALSILLRAYQLPVFIVAPAAHLAAFRKVSANAGSATAMVEVATTINEYGLEKVMSSYIGNWQALKERRLLVQLEQSLHNGKLAVGIGEVWTAALEKRGRLLVVEEDYVYPAYIDAQGGMLYADTIPLSQTSRHTKDAVADAMELALASGGKLELVSKGVLSEYVHMAMICY